MRPILFNTDMVRAILSGSKTVTRRICRDANKLTVPLSDTIDHNACTYTVEGINEDGITQYLAERRMPYAAGDILWVRETWAYGNIETSDFEARANESWFEEARFPVKSFGGYHDPILFYRADMDEKDARELCMRWRPSIHMPKEAARLFLRVTDVRLERLREISEEQAQREGIRLQHEDFIPAYHYRKAELPGDGWKTAGSAFAALWNSTVRPQESGRYGWDANPWVWVIEFERMKEENTR